ncbi:hypothetical protein HanIR_Chr11g0507621 [Helianthus annuus]|nr:hypothetical protein HanIR_Chr11g0507621 [Helianthus annuus]
MCTDPCFVQTCFADFLSTNYGCDLRYKKKKKKKKKKKTKKKKKKKE